MKSNMTPLNSQMMISENMNRGDCLDCHTCNNFGLHIDVKFKVIFKINIVIFLIIHVVIDFNESHLKKFGRVLRKNYGFIIDF
jgi:hypothetical protein